MPLKPADPTVKLNRDGAAVVDGSAYPQTVKGAVSIVGPVELAPQGTQDVNVTNAALPITDGGGSLTVDVAAPLPVTGEVTVAGTVPVMLEGAVSVGNRVAVDGAVDVRTMPPVVADVSGSKVELAAWPEQQEPLRIKGLVGAAQVGDWNIEATFTPPASQTVDDGGGSLTVDGAVDVTGSTVDIGSPVSISGTVPVSIAGTVPVSGTVGVSGTVSVDGSIVNAQQTGPWSVSVPGVATEATLSALNDKFSQYAHDPNNEITTLLGANEVFTGDWTDVENYQCIAVSVISDVGPAGAQIEWSADGINPDTSLFGTTPVESVNAGAWITTKLTALKIQRYYRLVYTNGATPQTLVHGLALLVPQALAGDTKYLFETLSQFSLGLSAKALMCWDNDSGSYPPVSEAAPLPVTILGDTAASGSISGGGGAVTMDLNGRSGLSFQITGTWSGTIVFEASVDGSTYTDSFAFGFGSQAIASSTTANGAWTAAVPGFKKWRVRGTSWSSGTATVTAYGSAGAAALGYSVLAGALGAFDSNVTQIDSAPIATGVAGSTGGTQRVAISTDSLANRLNVLGQTTAANSAPVVIASDQSAIPVTQSFEREVVFNNDTLTTTGIFTLPDTLGEYPELVCEFEVNGAITGTSPTLVVSLLELNPETDNSSGGTTLFSSSGSAVSSGSVVVNPSGSKFAVQYVVGGATPSFGGVYLTITGHLGSSQVASNLSVGAIGTASPTSATMTGADDGSGNFVKNRGYNLNGAGSEYVFGVNLRTTNGSGASFELGTSAHPVRTDPTGTTTQPISAASLPLPTGAAAEHTTADSPHAVRLTDGSSFYSASTASLALESGGNLATLAGAVANEDSASANADPGFKLLAVRKATPANTSGTDGDYEFLQMSAGRLWGSSIAYGPDPEGNAPTQNPVLMAGYTGTSVARIKVDNSGQILLVGAGAHASPVVGNPIRIAGWDTSATRNIYCDANGYLRADVRPPYLVTSDRPTQNATKFQVVSGESYLYDVTVENPNTSVVYLQIFYQPSSGVTVGTTTPDMVLPIPPGSSSSNPGILCEHFQRLLCNTGITIAITTTRSGSTSPSSNCACTLNYAVPL